MFNSGEIVKLQFKIKELERELKRKTERIENLEADRGIFCRLITDIRLEDICPGVLFYCLSSHSGGRREVVESSTGYSLINPVDGSGTGMKVVKTKEEVLRYMKQQEYVKLELK